MEKTLFAVDELSGFIVAVALIKPSKSLADVDLRGVKKRLKEKAFARGVRREDVYLGAEELGVPLDELIEETITALQGIAGELGLE
jgi:predicted hydrolase (HD superfamily)